MLTIKQTKTAQPMGQYAPTAVDQQKQDAQIRITATTSKGYEVMTAMPLTGRGIKRIGCAFIVTDAAMEDLRRRYTVACDF